MRLQHLILTGALTAMPLMVANTAAEAARVCKCTDITFPGGSCTHYGQCTIVQEMVGTQPLTHSKACHRTQMLVCDESDDSCQVVCAPKQKQSADAH